jgi:hypothetical protein
MTKQDWILLGVSSALSIVFWERAVPVIVAVIVANLVIKAVKK